MQTQTSPPGASPKPPKRYFRNYLLDARFQLKFTAYAVGVTLVVVALLGIFLWMTSQALFRETEMAVDARSKAAETSKELGNSALSNTLLEHFNDPEFEKTLRAQSQEIDEKYEAEKAAIVTQQIQIKKQQRTVGFALIGGLLGFVAFIAMGSILTTHRIVGPLFRFKRMAQEVAAGKLKMPTFGLRQGDEFQDFFELLTRMIEFLRAKEAEDIQKLTEALDKARTLGLNPEVLRPLEELMEIKRRRLAE